MESAGQTLALVFEDDAPPAGATAPHGLRYYLTVVADDRPVRLFRSVLDEAGEAAGSIDVDLTGPQLKLLCALLKQRLKAQDKLEPNLITYRDVPRLAEIKDLYDNGQAHDLINDIRAQLFDNPKLHKRSKDKALIKTVPGVGYSLNREVRRQTIATPEPADAGDLILRQWDDGKWFYRIIEESVILQQAKGSDATDADGEHIQILTTAFSRRAEDENNDLRGLSSLLKAGVHVSVLFINPKNTPLMEARHGLRKDYPDDDYPTALDWAVAHASEQIGWVARRIAQYPHLLKGRLIDYMPPAFVIRNSSRALIGFFMAFGSFADFPLLEITPASPMWQGLVQDWKLRWDAGKDIPAKPSSK